MVVFYVFENIWLGRCISFFTKDTPAVDHRRTAEPIFLPAMGMEGGCRPEG